LLRIREFIRGKHEQTWIKIYNDAFREYEDFRPYTLRDMEDWEKYPVFRGTRMFIAQINGKPVGCVNAFVDVESEEKKGFINNLGVIPRYRRRGIGRALLGKAFESLIERGILCAEAVAPENKMAIKRLLESKGFELVRLFSIMVSDLSRIPSNIGENPDVRIEGLRKDSMDDIRLFNQLYNEAFKEHFNFRNERVEETAYWIRENPWVDQSQYFFAQFKGKTLGFVGAAIDAKFNEYQQKKRGLIPTIGVIEPYRRLGIGKALTLHALNFLKSRSMNEAMLGVDDSNPTHALELYEKVGFKVVRKNLTYQKRLFKPAEG
jgi:mycothiol synthase